MIRLIIFAFIFICSFTYTAEAIKIYQWIDEKGVVHAVDDPDKVPKEYRQSADVIDTGDGSLETEARIFLTKVKSNGSVLLTGLAILVLIFVFIKSVSFLHARKKEGEREAHLNAYKISGVGGMDQTDFKRYVIGLLKERGYSVMAAPELMSPVVDLIAEKDGSKYAVHINTQSNNISRVIVNDLDREKARHGCGKSMIISRQFSDEDARSLGQSVGCSLVDRDMLPRWIYDFQRKS